MEAGAAALFGAAFYNVGHALEHFTKLQIELCAPRDYISHSLVVSRCWGFQLSAWFVNPEAHRNALSGDEILLAHFSTR
jgi:hypothetical protein